MDSPSDAVEELPLWGRARAWSPSPSPAPEAPPAAPPKQRPPSPHAGHRERLRERADKGGLAALPDYELLELLIARSLPRGDVKPLAKALLTRFGSLAAVLGAGPSELVAVKGVGPGLAMDLRLVHEATLRIGREAASRRTVISSWSALVAYVKVALAHEPREQFRVIFLDKKNQLIADETMNRGTVDHAPVYPREVMRRALELSSSNIILLHNHPSGDPTPSRPDIEMTKQIVEAGKALKINVHDHLVVGRDGVASFKALGLF
jgi:DNA repair protein RadC